MPERRVILAAGAGCLASPSRLFAQAYPSRPLRLVVPFAAGGATDLAARILAEAMARDLSSPLVVENRPGAGSTIGVGFVAKAAPDGYTLLFAGNELVSSPSLYRRLDYDAAADFQPVSQITRMPSLLVVPAGSPFTDARQIAEAARARPDGLSYASGGNGTLPHFCAEMFKQAAGGLRILHVPYRGTPDMLSSLRSGQTAFTFATPSSAAGQIRDGALRVLATTGEARAEIAPEAPTVAELFPPGFSLYGWGGLLAPKGLPEPRLARLHAAVRAGLATPSVREALQGAGFEIVGSAPGEFAERIAGELTAWPAIVQLAGVRID